LRNAPILRRSGTHQKRQQGKRMKKILKIIGGVVAGIVVVGVVGTMAYWGYL